MMAVSKVGLIVIAVAIFCVVLLGLGVLALLVRVVIELAAGFLRMVFGSSHKPIPPTRVDPRRRGAGRAIRCGSRERAARICPSASCGHRNRREARYCARCGVRL